MFTKTIETFFKTVRDDKSPKNGQKRPDAKFTIQAFAADDLLLADGVIGLPVHVAAAVNSVLEQYGKSLIAARSGDWDYVPAENAVTLHDWYKEYTSETSRKREVTKESLAAFGRLYQRLAVQYLGKSQTVAAAGASVCEKRLVPIAGNTAAMQAMKSNLEMLVLAVAESEESSVLDSHEAVLQSLLKSCDAALSAEVSADML